MLMEVTGPEKGLTKLENLADDLDANPRGYDQQSFGSCALGRHFKNEGRFHEVANSCTNYGFQNTGGPYGLAAQEFGITREEAFRLFCASASKNHDDAHEAAERIRKFVSKKRPGVLSRLVGLFV